MKDQRPYLLRALYDWIVDSDCTPYLVVMVTSDDVLVPPEHVSEGRIILNISPNAVRSLSLGDERVEFDSRFSGRQFWVNVPVSSIVAIYARETGKGMAFDDAESAAPAPAPAPAPAIRQVPSEDDATPEPSPKRKRSPKQKKNKEDKDSPKGNKGTTNDGSHLKIIK